MRSVCRGRTVHRPHREGFGLENFVLDLFSPETWTAFARRMDRSQDFAQDTGV